MACFFLGRLFGESDRVTGEPSGASQVHYSLAESEHCGAKQLKVPPRGPLINILSHPFFMRRRLTRRLTSLLRAKLFSSKRSQRRGGARRSVFFCGLFGNRENREEAAASADLDLETVCRVFACKTFHYVPLSGKDFE